MIITGWACEYTSRNPILISFGMISTFCRLSPKMWRFRFMDKQRVVDIGRCEREVSHILIDSFPQDARFPCINMVKAPVLLIPAGLDWGCIVIMNLLDRWLWKRLFCSPPLPCSGWFQSYSIKAFTRWSPRVSAQLHSAANTLYLQFEPWNEPKSWRWKDCVSSNTFDVFDWVALKGFHVLQRCLPVYARI